MFVYTDTEGTAWRRVGECNNCGECCFGGDPSPANPLFTDAERETQTIVGRCPLLRLDGDHYRCAGHGKHPFYLGGCNTWPSRPEDMILAPSCSFRWERV